MPVVYRPARLQDLGLADELVVSSINDLTTRNGLGPMAAVSTPLFQSFSLKDDPDGLWVAEESGQILGFAFSWVCGDLWFLAQLFVSPRQQGRGIGNELLKRTLEHAQKAGGINKALITFTFNTVSQGLYMRHGLFPRLPIYFFNVTREVLTDRLQGKRFRCAPVDDPTRYLRTFAEIDVRALGISREKHHRYLIENNVAKCIALFDDSDDCMGYAYISPDGHIGPLAVGQHGAMGTAFRTALSFAADGTSSNVSAFLPGASETALRIAVEHAMRITFPMVLMSTQDFGDWSRYLPRNPGFM